MRSIKQALMLFCALFLFAINLVSAQGRIDQEGVKEAVLDYIEGIYNMQPERITRSVHQTLSKVGYWPRRDGTGYDELRLTFDQLREMAQNYNRDGHVAADASKEIQIYEVLDKTATVKLTAEWGIDYMLLAKLDGKWMIMNILWQGFAEE